MSRKLNWLILLCSYISIGVSFASKQVSLIPLECDETDVIGCNVGIRPYRTGGIRIETESCDDKLIIHNYGHGGSGATLAPGCVEKAISLFNQRDPEKKQVSILGSGYMGLLTAQELAEAGYQITVYADQFPTNDYFYKTGEPCITSLVAGGLWFPSTIDHGDEDLFKSLCKNSYHLYKQKIESKIPGVSLRTAYSFPRSDASRFPEEIDLPEHVEVTFGSKYFPASKWSTILIEGNVFLNSLQSNLMENKNVTFIKKKFSHIDDVLEISDTFIFNCTGYGSKSLFNDTAIKPVRGQLLYLKPQPSFDYFLFGGGDFGRFSLFPSADKIVIGGTYEKDVENCDTVQAELDKLRENVASFFKDKIH